MGKRVLLLLILLVGPFGTVALATVGPSELSAGGVDAINGVWTPVRQPPLPPWGTGPLFVDASRDRLVKMYWHGEMWAIPLEAGGEWAKVNEPGGGPTGYIDWGSAHDVDGDRIIVFGGWKLGADPYSGNLWQHSLEPGSGWALLTAAGTPPPAAGFYVGAFDGANRRALFFGGYNGSYVSRVWALNLNGPPTWEELIPENPIPWPYVRQAATYDPVRNRVILLVVDRSAYTHRMLEFRLEPEPAWGEIFPYGLGWAGTEDNGNPSLVYDRIHDRAILSWIPDDYAYTAELWSINFATPEGPTIDLIGTNPMLPRAGGGTPTSLAVAYDERRNRILYHGGRYSNTWSMALDSSADWQAIAASPLPRIRPSLFYDSRRDRTLLTSGLTERGYDDLTYGFVVRGDPISWELNSEDPIQWVPSRIPSLTLANQRPVYLDSRDEALLVAGTTVDLVDCDHRGVVEPPANEVWALDLTEARLPRRLPATAFGAGASAMFDPTRQQILSYGGVTYSYVCDHVVVTQRHYLDALRSFSLDAPSAWQVLPAVPNSPGPRAWHSSVYDPVGDRMLVFGGATPEQTELNELWALTLADPMNWERVDAPGDVPPATANPQAILDPVRERLLVFDAAGGVRALPLRGEAVWQRLTPAGTPPSFKGIGAISYDSKRDRVILYAAETWILTFGDPLHEIQAAWIGNRRRGLPSPDSNGMIQLVVLSDSEFNAFELDLETVRVGDAPIARAGNGDFLASQLDRDHDGTRDLQFHVRIAEIGTDPDSSPLRVEGRTKDGRLVRAYVSSQGPRALSPQGSPGGPAIDESPLAFDVQFSGALGTGSSLAMRVTLPGPGDLRIAIYDARGRRVHSQEFGQLSAGSQDLDVDAPRLVAVGIYFCRVQHGEQTLTRKVVFFGK